MAQAARVTRTRWIVRAGRKVVALRMPRPAALAILLAAMASATAAAPVAGQTPELKSRAPGAAQRPALEQRVPVAVQTPGLEHQVRAIASRLRCPVCQNESVADSPSQLAGQMRALIRARLEEGQSPQEIIAYFVSRYGEWILLDPPRKGVGWILWSAPVAVLLAALAAAGAFLRRTVRPQKAADRLESGAR